MTHEEWLEKCRYFRFAYFIEVIDGVFSIVSINSFYDGFITQKISKDTFLFEYFSNNLCSLSLYKSDTFLATLSKNFKKPI